MVYNKIINTEVDFMALVKCPECKKEVSDTAETCPHCGYRLKKPISRPTTTYYSNRASNIVERDHNMKHIGGIISGIIGIIAGIICFCLCGIKEAQAFSEVKATLIICGIILIIPLSRSFPSAYRNTA